jgi:hypothetical protein
MMMTILFYQNDGGFMIPKLVIVDRLDDNVGLIKEGLGGLDDISVVKLQPDEIPSLPNIDALYLPLAMAEAWGARPDFYKAQVINTEGKNLEISQSSPFPPYLVTGVAIKPDDPNRNDPIFQLRLIISATLEAVEKFNAMNQGAIRNIVFWAENLLLKQIEPTHIGRIIRDIYKEKLIVN